MHAHTRPDPKTMATLPGRRLFRSLHRDWLSWTRTERAAAVAILLGAPASVACILGTGLVA